MILKSTVRALWPQTWKVSTFKSEVTTDSVYETGQHNTCKTQCTQYSSDHFCTHLFKLNGTPPGSYYLAFIFINLYFIFLAIIHRPTSQLLHCAVNEPQSHIHILHRGPGWVSYLFSCTQSHCTPPQTHTTTNSHSHTLLLTTLSASGPIFTAA